MYNFRDVKLDEDEFSACISPKVYKSLSEGTHTFEVKATDGSGNTDNTSASYTWVIDVTAPDTSIDSQPSEFTNSTSASFEFTSTEEGSIFECQIDSGGYSACTSPKEYTSLAEGSHTFEVRATDTAENTDATPASYTWEVDLTPPSAPTGLTATPGDSEIVLSWNTISDANSYNVYYDTDTTNPPYVYSVTSTTNGASLSGLINCTTYYISVTASDLAGNESVYSDEISATPYEEAEDYRDTEDEDCNGIYTDGTVDNDNDGFHTDGTVLGVRDCDDNDPDIYPGAGLCETLPDTGQTACYDNSLEITCPLPGEVFYGQDAQYSTHPMSFTDNGDGTATDNVTGLMWEQKTTTNKNDTYFWQGAIDYCSSLTLGGYDDWYLPDEYALQGIVDYEVYSPAIDTDYFPNTISSSYWSSSTDVSGADTAWHAGFFNGFVSGSSKSYGKYVRCVRSGQLQTINFIDNNDGTVTDNVTGLMWEQKTTTNAGDIYTWEDALDYCEAIELGGYDDWRLPNAKELPSLVDNTIYNPAIDTDYFPKIRSSSYWSSSTKAGDIDLAWGTHFFDGCVSHLNKSNGYYVRCVRSEQ